jgi:hypothetical protein
VMVVNGNAVGKGDWGTELVANIDNLYVSVCVYIYIYVYASGNDMVVVLINELVWFDCLW